MSILGDQYDTAIKGFEGFAPRASWDYKQNSVGWGTRARAPNEVIDPAEAQRRYDEEIAKAHGIVRSFAPNVDHGTAAALTSLTFNAGDAWTKSGLGAAIQSGDLDKARASFLQYVNAGGAPLDGLRKRRAAEVAWIGAGGQPDQTGQAPMAMRPRGTRWDEALPLEGGEPWDGAQPQGMMPPQQMPAPSVAGYQGRAAPPVRMGQEDERPSILQEIVGRASNPLFQQGLGMFLAARKGGDLNAGLNAGTERAQAMQSILQKNLQHQQQMKMREAAQALLADSNRLAGVPPVLVEAARITGDMTPVTNFLAKHPEIELERERARLQRDDLTERVAARRAESDYKLRSLPMLERKTAAEVKALEEGKLEKTAEYRRAQMEAAGLDPNEDRNREYIATGKMPREDQSPLTATDKKAILEADDQVLTTGTAIKQLQEAAAISPKTNQGFAAGLRAQIADKLPDVLVPDFISSKDSAKATIDYENITLGQALSQLKATFGGAPTEGERAILLQLQASVGMSPEARKPILERAMALAALRQREQQERADGLRNKTFYKPKAAGSASAAPVAPVGSQPPAAPTTSPKDMSDEELLRLLSGGR